MQAKNPGNPIYLLIFWDFISCVNKVLPFLRFYQFLLIRLNVPGVCHARICPEGFVIMCSIERWKVYAETKFCHGVYVIDVLVNKGGA
jgi:hypothetical protein